MLRSYANLSDRPNSHKPWRHSWPPSRSRQVDASADPVRALCRSSRSELLLEHPLFEIELAVEEQGHRDVAVLVDIDGDDIARLGIIGDSADWAFVGLERLEPDLRLVR